MKYKIIYKILYIRSGINNIYMSKLAILVVVLISKRGELYLIFYIKKRDTLHVETLVCLERRITRREI